VQVALEFYDALNRDDREAALDLTHPDVEIVTIAGEATGVANIDSGHEGLKRFWAQLDAFPSKREALEAAEHGRP
jgi:ketosteroid isomerase-like protein